MKILAIDTSTEACSAALLYQGDIRERFELAPRQHAELVLGMADSLLAEAGLAPASLDAVALGRGPGAFTGLRIGAGVVQGIAFAAELPVVPVSTLAAMAQGALRQWGKGRVIPAIDARMQEIYAAAYSDDGNGLMQPVIADALCTPDNLPLPEGGGWFGAGSGWAAYETELGRIFDGKLDGYEAEHYPHARDVALLAARDFAAGQAVAAHEALPVYLRDQVVQNPQRKA